MKAAAAAAAAAAARVRTASFSSLSSTYQLFCSSRSTWSAPPTCPPVTRTASPIRMSSFTCCPASLRPPSCAARPSTRTWIRPSTRCFTTTASPCRTWRIKRCAWPCSTRTSSASTLSASIGWRWRFSIETKWTISMCL